MGYDPIQSQEWFIFPLLFLGLISNLYSALNPSLTFLQIAGGHETEPFVRITYASVFSRESMMLTLLAASLDVLGVLVANIVNNYLNDYFCRTFGLYLVISLVSTRAGR